MTAANPPSHKWVAQVLRDRGFPAPPPSDIAKAVATWNAEQSSSAMTALRRIESGTDTPEDYASVKKLLILAPGGDHVSEEHTQPTRTQEAKKSRLDAAAEPIERVKHHIYATKGAVTVEMAPVPAARGQRPRMTMMIEAAQGDGTRSFDWEHKIIFSVMLRELPLVAAAFLGLLDRPVVFANHGDANDKRLEIVGQGDRVVLKVMQGRRAIAVPVMAYDCFATLDIALNALTMNSPHLKGELMHAMLRRVAQMHNQQKQE